MSGADEMAVELFLQRKIRFDQIAALIERTLDEHLPIAHPSIEDIIAAEHWAREAVQRSS